MSIRNIRRQATNPLAAPGTPNSAPIYVDSDDNKLKFIPAGSGTAEIELVDVSSTQTLANKTFGAGAVEASETGTTTANLVNYGLSTIVGTSSAGPIGYTLALPVRGISKTIADIGTLTTGNATVTAATGSNFTGPTGTVVTFTTQGYISLYGVTSSQWAIVGLSSGSVSVA